MADLEKVIKALEWILKDDRFGFGKGLTKPETDEEQAGCYIHDALELLKEQQNRIDVLRSEVKRLDVDIVRCKDCKFADQYIEPDKYGRYGLCEIHNRIIPRQDFFCADGEREG